MTLTVAAARLKDWVESVPLVVIASISGETYYFSDRVITVGGITYDSMLINAGDITEESARADSTALNSDVSLELRNDSASIGGTDYAALIEANEDHPLYGAEVRISAVFLDGADQSPEVLLFVGASESPTAITRKSLTIPCSSMAEYKNGSFEQGVLLTADYPDADENEAGAVFPDLIGQFKNVRCIRTVWPNYAENSGETGASEFTIANHALHSVTEIRGEYSELSAGIVDNNVTLTARAKATIVKTAMQVASAIIDTLEIDTDSVATAQREYAENDGFNPGQGGSAEKTFTWGANPYAGKNFTSLRMNIKYSFSNADPVDTDTAGSHYVYVYAYPGGVQTELWRGRTYWVASEVSSRTPTTQIASVASFNIGSWQTSIRVLVVQNTRCGYEVEIDTAYQSLVAPSLSVTSSDEKYYEDIYASGWGAKSTDAKYGTVGSAISRPDHVMKYWIVERLGFALADIDDASFDAAGTWYASNSYALSVVIAEDVDALEELYRMAYECRSIISYSLGKWYLAVVPDAAPAATKPISADDLAGDDAVFTFGYTDIADVANVLTVQYDKNHMCLTDTEEWLASIAVEDVPVDHQRAPKTIQLRYVMLDAMAADVADNMLLQSKTVKKTVEFESFWADTDLIVGNTIEVADQGFWDGVKFFIESATRTGVNRCKYKAVAWW